MGRWIVEGVQVIFETAGNHVEVDAAAIKITEAGNDLGDAVRVQVYGLDGHKRGENARVLQDDLGDDPGVERAVVGIDENARAAGLFAPPGYADHLAQVLLGRHVDSERAGGEDCRDSRVPAVFRTSIGSGDDGRRIRRCD